MASHNFKSVEEIDETEALIDYDIFYTHGGLDETRVDDVCDLLRCDNEVSTPRENDTYENFDSQQIDGKTFDTLEAAYEFYNQYALLNGFGTRKHNVHKIRETSVTLSKKLGVWVVDKFQDVHNHPLTTTPSKKKKITNLSEYYILPRWTIHARYKVGDVGNRMDEISRHSTEKRVSLLTLWSVRAKFTRAIDNGRNYPSKICEIDARLSSFLEKQAARKNVEKRVGDKMVIRVSRKRYSAVDFKEGERKTRGHVLAWQWTTPNSGFPISHSSLTKETYLATYLGRDV
ncbi:hypothetical protein RJ640_017695 [Escallonia rubra]|uniref:Protein FAR1-RELATED SEQUENCE n=1 Tax=Escallonia rubra TaxID=112253 RepID=A0AA88RWL5_9ASTE|nr:hypothetical protein RJ640_017695 [Escallonia rubra]